MRTKTNTVHLSLNFDISEHLGNELLISIADEYMKKIGFGCQPYLVYKHLDAAHPHVHIVTTNIDADGKRISLHNIGELVSEPARKAIEIEFGLVRADRKKARQELDEVVKIKPLHYGMVDTKRGITKVVNAVIKTYKFTSLPELNAILNQFNVLADRGTKNSIMFKKGGLHYWILDQVGKKGGVSIKASSLNNKPTLKLLEDRFKLNEYLRKPFREKLKAKIDSVKSQAISFDQFKSRLEKADITIVTRQNDEGRIYGMSYIDNVNRVIFNGSDLGKPYSAAAIIGSLHFMPAATVPASVENATSLFSRPESADKQFATPSPGLLEDLLSPLGSEMNATGQLGPKKKKKKRRKLNL